MVRSLGGSCSRCSRLLPYAAGAFGAPSTLRIRPKLGEVIIHSDNRRLVLVLDLYREQECTGAQIPSREFLLSLARSVPFSPHPLGQELYLSCRRCWQVSWLSSTKAKVGILLIVNILTEALEVQGLGIS